MQQFRCIWAWENGEMPCRATDFCLEILGGIAKEHCHGMFIMRLER